MQNSENHQRIHKPVLVKEAIEALKVSQLAHLNSEVRFIDATVGLAGHTLEILKFGVNVLGIDYSKEELEVAQNNLEKACPTANSNVDGPNFRLVYGNFRDIDKIAVENGFAKVDGILYDLGISSPQITSDSLGLSFQHPEADLDMRLDPETLGVKASDLLNALSFDQLVHLFRLTEVEGKAYLLARKVVAKRNFSKFEKVGDFLEIFGKRNTKSHPATAAFLALRIAVNGELENLKESLPKAFNLLKKGGRLVVISFHSGEDKITKVFFKEMELKGLGKIVTQKPTVPDKDEVGENSRARSAKMRVLERLD